MMEGGFQVNAEGRRFSNEHGGYSEQAKIVAAQPGAVAWNIYDSRRHDLGREFEDYRDAMAAGAVVEADSIEALAARLALPADALAETAAQVAAFAENRATDSFGRDFTNAAKLEPPYFGIKICGALFPHSGRTGG